jgi:hypothetical protein
MAEVAMTITGADAALIMPVALCPVRLLSWLRAAGNAGNRHHVVKPGNTVWDRRYHIALTTVNMHKH